MELKNAKIKKYLMFRVLEEEIVNCAMDLLALKKVVIENAKEYGYTEEEMIEHFDYKMTKAKEAFEKADESGNEILIDGIERVKETLLLSDAEIHVTFV